MLEPDHHICNAKVGNQIHKSSVSVCEVLANELYISCLDPAARQHLVEAIADAADAV